MPGALLQFEILNDTLARALVSSALKRRCDGARFRPGSIVFLSRPEDRARLLAAFIDPEDPGKVHLVWDDEYHPVAEVDEAYREYRKRANGRASDLETICVRRSYVWYPWTGSLPNLTWATSLHGYDYGPVRRRGDRIVIFINTWNHMMYSYPHTLPRTRYRVEDPDWLWGTREDAERFARALG